MNRLLLTAGIAAGSIAFASTARANDLIAYWAFNDFDPATVTVIPADEGAGQIDVTAWTGTLHAFGGSSINALPGYVDGNSLVVQGEAGNGTYIQISFSMQWYEGLEISFATRGTSTGFNAGQWSYSTDGASFTNFGPNTATRNTTYALAGPFGTSGLDLAPTAYLRYTLDGATSSSGSNRIENLQLRGVFVPEPATAGLLGLAGLGLLARRRRA